MSINYTDFLHAIAESDVVGLRRAEQSYGSSWKRRTGVGAFMMLARKWDRIEQRVNNPEIAANAAPLLGHIFAHVVADRRAEGIIDDIRDLRRYLILVESEMTARRDSTTDSGKRYLDRLPFVTRSDIDHINQTWAATRERPTGAETFRVLAERWGRIEQRVGMHIEPAGARPGATKYDVFEHIAADSRAEGILEDIRGLRRHLMVVEAEMAARGQVAIGTARDNREAE